MGEGALKHATCGCCFMSEMLISHYHADSVETTDSAGKGGGGQYYIGQGDDLENFVDEEPHKVDNVREATVSIRCNQR